MPDYSEFPTTPTAWQEAHLRDWQTITPLATEDPEPAPRRRGAGSGSSVASGVMVCESRSCASCQAVGVVGNSL